MKRISTAVVAAALLASLMFTACASGPVPETSAAPEVTVLTGEVVDWADRNLGNPQQPAWVYDLVVAKNSEAAKTQLNIGEGRVVKFSTATSSTLANAQSLSRTNYAATLSRELKISVIAMAGSDLDNGQLAALDTVATKTMATLTGQREEAYFWQRIVGVDPVSKRKTDEYVYYTVYSMDESTWDAILRKYLTDIIGDNSISEDSKRRIGALYSELLANEQQSTAQKAAEMQASYETQIERIGGSAAEISKDASVANVEKAADYSAYLK